MSRKLSRTLEESEKVLEQLQAAPDPERFSRLMRDLNVVARGVTGRRHRFQTAAGALRAMGEAREELSKGKDQLERLVAAR